MPKKQTSRSNQASSSNIDEPAQIPTQEPTQHVTLYNLLEVEPNATTEQIKKQYRKLVLIYHPDKNKGDPSARQKFQKLKEAYDILIHDEKRKEYDETGQVGENFNQSTFQSAYEYFRKLYKKVTKEDIDTFESQYRQGPMEEEDLIDYYNQHQGSMVELIESIPLSRNEDISRFISYFEKQIESKTIPHFKAFDKTKNKVRLLKNEQKEWEQEQKKASEAQKKDMNSLILAIQNKKEGQIDFIASLEQKYGVGKKRKIQKEGKNKK